MFQTTSTKIGRYLKKASGTIALFALAITLTCCDRGSYREFKLQSTSGTGKVIEKKIKVKSSYLHKLTPQKKYNREIVYLLVIYPDMIPPDIYCRKNDCSKEKSKPMIIFLSLRWSSTFEEWEEIKKSKPLIQEIPGHYRTYKLGPEIESNRVHYLEVDNNCCPSVAYLRCFGEDPQRSKCDAIGDYKDQYRVQFSFFREDLPHLGQLTSKVAGLLNEVVIEAGEPARAH